MSVMELRDAIDDLRVRVTELEEGVAKLEDAAAWVTSELGSLSDRVAALEFPDRGEASAR